TQACRSRNTINPAMTARPVPQYANHGRPGTSAGRTVSASAHTVSPTAGIQDASTDIAAPAAVNRVRRRHLTERRSISPVDVTRGSPKAVNSGGRRHERPGHGLGTDP